MRKFNVVLGALLLSSCFAHGAESKQNLFSCVDVKNYSVDSQCASSLISSNEKFQAMQQDIQLKAEQQNPNVLATVQFYPAKMLIKVSAHREQLDEPALLVMTHP
ncbi:pyridine nucleotide transhydrogenase [Paraglaciecola sp.]|uniref:pyridine nucleotide transhydrogenase n=1 Tax=Paraglaciecola sp. TaxID=1920173 RepID=UPI0030F3AFD9